MNRISRFFHEFVHPHCIECGNDKTCKSCETLREQLALVNEDKRKLLEIILEKNKTIPEEINKPSEHKPVGSSYVPWNVRRAALEAEDREKARILRDREPEQKEIEKLEKEIGIGAGAEEKRKSS